jgi:hypothetical protein
MKNAIWTRAVLSCCALLFPVFAQDLQQPGKSIGKVTTLGNLIVMTLNEGALGRANNVRPCPPHHALHA